MQTGGQPLSGGEIRLFDRSGSLLTKTVIAADGSFSLLSPGSGLVRIEVAAVPGGPVLTTSYASAIPGATLKLAQDWPVDRAKALSKVLSGATSSVRGGQRAQVSVDSSSMVLQTMTPLPPNVSLQPAMVDKGRPTTFLNTLPEEQWFFLIDPNPTMRYSKPVTYVLVGARTGEVLIHNDYWFPRINGSTKWMSDKDFTDYTNVDFSSLDSGPTSGTSTATVEVAQMPNLGALTASVHQGTLGAAAGKTPPLAKHNTTSDSVYALIIAGYDETGMIVDIDRVQKFLVRKGVPEGNFQMVRLFGTRATKDAEGNWDRSEALGRIRSAVSQLRTGMDSTFELDGSHATLLIYISTHCSGWMTYSAQCLVDGAWVDDALYLSVNDVLSCGILDSNFSRVRMILDACSAGNAFDISLNSLRNAKPARAYPDLVFYGASDRSEFSAGYPAWVRYSPLPGHFGGGWFTYKFCDVGSLASGDIVLTTGPNSDTYLPALVSYTSQTGTQHPSIRRLTSSPSWAVPTIKSFSPTQISFGDQVTLSGKALAGKHPGTKVYFNQILGTVLTDQSDDTTLVAKAPANAFPNGSITLETVDGVAVSSQSYTFIPRRGSFSYSMAGLTPTYAGAVWNANDGVTTYDYFINASQTTIYLNLAFSNVPGLKLINDVNGVNTPILTGLATGGMGVTLQVSGRSVSAKAQITAGSPSQSVPAHDFNISPADPQVIRMILNGTLDGDTPASSSSITGTMQFWEGQVNLNALDSGSGNFTFNIKH